MDLKSEDSRLSTRVITNYILDLSLSLSLSYSMGSMPVGVHDILHDMGPFLPVHRQSVQSADVLVTPVRYRSSVHLLLGLPLLFLPFIIPKTTCFISLSSSF